MCSGPWAPPVPLALPLGTASLDWSARSSPTGLHSVPLSHLPGSFAHAVLCPELCAVSSPCPPPATPRSSRAGRFLVLSSSPQCRPPPGSPSAHHIYRPVFVPRVIVSQHRPASRTRRALPPRLTAGVGSPTKGGECVSGIFQQSRQTFKNDLMTGCNVHVQSGSR